MKRDFLTVRETQVLTCWAQGLTAKDTAKRLGITDRTVASHRRRLRSALRASSMVKAFHIARDRGLLDVMKAIENENLYKLNRPVPPRQLRTLELLVQGMEPKAIAKQLGIAVGTVRHHIKKLHIKFGAHTNAQVVALAYKTGVLRLADN